MTGIDWSSQITTNWGLECGVICWHFHPFQGVEGGTSEIGTSHGQQIVGPKGYFVSQKLWSFFAVAQKDRQIGVFGGVDGCCLSKNVPRRLALREAFHIADHSQKREVPEITTAWQKWPQLTNSIHMNHPESAYSACTKTYELCESM